MQNIPIKNINLNNLNNQIEEDKNGEQLAKLVLKSLFEFASSFPLYIRKWIQQSDRKYTKMAEGIIKTFISSAIFQKEVQQIEVR